MHHRCVFWSPAENISLQMISGPWEALMAQRSSSKLFSSVGRLSWLSDLIQLPSLTGRKAVKANKKAIKA